MATELRTDVTRAVQTGGTEMVVTLTPAGLLIREKGKRTTYGPISYGALLSLGAKQFAEAERRAKEDDSKPRKVRRGALA